MKKKRNFFKPFCVSYVISQNRYILNECFYLLFYILYTKLIMKKNDVYVHACKILNLLSEERRLSIRGLLENTNTRECTTFMAFGWLSTADKVQLI